MRQFGQSHDPIELLGRERGKRMVWEATDVKKAKMAQYFVIPGRAVGASYDVQLHIEIPGIRCCSHAPE